MTLKLIICQSESPQPAASLILISQITSSLVIIPDIIFSKIFISYQIEPKNGKARSSSAEETHKNPSLTLESKSADSTAGDERLDSAESTSSAQSQRRRERRSKYKAPGVTAAVAGSMKRQNSQACHLL